MNAYVRHGKIILGPRGSFPLNSIEDILAELNFLYEQWQASEDKTDQDSIDWNPDDQDS